MVGNKKVLLAVVVASMSLSACSFSRAKDVGIIKYVSSGGTALTPSEEVEIKDKAIESLSDITGNIVEVNALELEYVDGEDVHKIAKFSTYKEHGADMFISQDVKVGINDADESEAHSLDYRVNGKRYYKFVKGGAEALTKTEYNIEKDITDHDADMNRAFKIIKDNLEVDNVKVGNVAGEKLWHIEGKLPLEAGTSIMEINTSKLLNKDEATCNIDLYLDKNDYSVAEYEIQINDTNKDGKIKICKFNSAINYNDAYSIFDVSDLHLE